MKFLCLCYYDAARFAALSKDEMDAFLASCQPHDEALRRTGQLFAVGALGLPGASKTLRAEHAGRFMRGAIEIWPCEGFELGSTR